MKKILRGLVQYFKNLKGQRQSKSGPGDEVGIKEEVCAVLQRRDKKEIIK